MAGDVIIALDFPGAGEAKEFLEKLGSRRPYVKVGMELFYAEGPGFVRYLKERGFKVFLDLKLHDIPNTVKRAMAVVASLGTDIVNLHAAGGGEMMRAALEGLREGAAGQRPLLIAVTMLTSTGADMLGSELLIGRSMEETVLHYAENAAKSGLDGVVCSPLEAEAVKVRCGEGFITVTPGMRFQDSAYDDQKRVTTPARAREIGTDYIVVGRPVTAALDPEAAYDRCVEEFLA